jgi:hypothetical protein
MMGRKLTVSDSINKVGIGRMDTEAFLSGDRYWISIGEYNEVINPYKLTYKWFVSDVGYYNPGKIWDWTPAYIWSVNLDLIWADCLRCGMIVPTYKPGYDHTVWVLGDYGKAVTCENYTELVYSAGKDSMINDYEKLLQDCYDQFSKKSEQN